MKHHLDLLKDAAMEIGIIGAGYSGVSLAYNIYRNAAEPTHILLFERRKEHGLGAAYATTHAEHLLNVPAGSMSGLADDPDHFLNFVLRDKRAARYIRKDQPLQDQFFPRMVYGWYIQSLLAECQTPSARQVVVELVSDAVIDAVPTDDGFVIRTQNRRVIPVNKMVLATGNAHPANGLLAQVPARQLIADPWNYDAIRSIPHDRTVLVVGTGLTMVDTVIALKTLGHGGPIIALSRRGLVPQRHQSLDYGGTAGWEPDRLRHLRRKIRGAAQTRTAVGGDWREVINTLRYCTQELWTGLTVSEQKSFLRHLVPYWESHRHRLAPEIGDKLRAMIDSGQLRIMAGKIDGIDPVHGANSLRVQVRPRGGGSQTRVLVADYVINCTGPDTNISRSNNPLLQSLLRQRLIRPDIHRMGLDVAADGALINGQGESSETLFTLGPPTRGRWYEIVAVPDIRGQSLRLALRLLAPDRSRQPLKYVMKHQASGREAPHFCSE